MRQCGRLTRNCKRWRCDCRPVSMNLITESTCLETAPVVSDSAGLVSIVIPCYRGEAYLAQAIESCLAQTYTDLEIIVVDDASPDGCREIAERFAAIDPRVRVVARETNGGVARAFNSGFAAAQGEFLTRLAQDDVFEPNAIEQMVSRLTSAGAPVGLVYCDCVGMDERGNRLGTSVAPRPEEALRYRNQIGLCVMWTRRVWETVGGFDPECDAAEDYDYWLRVAARFDLARCDGPPALRVRFHPEMGSVRSAVKQVSSTHRAIRKAYGGRLRLNSDFVRRQMALGCARVTAGLALKDQQRYGAAFVQFLLSLAEWPWPYPAGVYGSRCFRPRALLGVTRKLLFG